MTAEAPAASVLGTPESAVDGLSVQVMLWRFSLPLFVRVAVKLTLRLEPPPANAAEQVLLTESEGVADVLHCAFAVGLNVVDDCAPVAEHVKVSAALSEACV